MAVEHAWSAVCDRVSIDRDTEALRLDVVDRLIVVSGVPAGDLLIVPCRLEIVSHWFRGDPALGQRSAATLRGLSPGGRELARFGVAIDLTACERVRTRCVLDGLAVEGEGRHLFTVGLDDGGRVVTRLPIDVVFRG